MSKNKKIVLSSIAIIFALVVSSIFVNYTLANSDSQASVSDATGSGTTTGLTGLSNIDLAIENSNNAGKKATGEDKYRIVQIVSDDYAANAAMDTQLKEKVTAPKFSGDAKKLDGYDTTTYLWRYVYAGEYFRLAVFDGYKTINERMAKGAVTLTTCTVSELNTMDKNAQSILNQADFIYIWANSASDYASTSKDLSEELYNWLDAYATAKSHPIAMCTGTLCTSEPENIVGNNDVYRMGALAYKLITKSSVARYENVLVTEADFFKTLYEEADENNEPTPDIEKTKYTISDFILKAERTASQGGSDYLNFGTYYKWYDGVSITDFLDGNIPDNVTDSTYDKAGSRPGLTGDNKDWNLNFDNAKILIISEDGKDSAMFSEIKGINSGNSAETSAGDYKFDDATQTWKSVEKAPNSVLTGHMYANGTSSSGTGISKYVPSGADIYVLDSNDIVDALTNGGVPYSNMSLASSAYKDVQTKTVSGTVRCTDVALDDDHGLVVSDVNLCAYLIVEDGTDLHIAGSSADEMIMCPLEEKEIPKLDADGNEVKDEDGNIVTEVVYTYSFPKLNPNYNYRVVIGGDDGFRSDDFTVGISQDAGKVLEDNENECVYDFSIKAADEDNVAGYVYRVDADGNEDASIVVTYDDFMANVGADGLGYAYKSDLLYEGFDLSDASKVAEYVKNLHDAYTQTQTGLVSENPDKVDLTQFDFIFIDKGRYNKEIGSDVFKLLVGGVESGQYFIVSSKAGDGVGSGSGSGDDNPDPGSSVINSPSAKAVADVINAGVYRDGTDNKYRVLEIQPDYPIDTDVAESKQGGSKYTKHSNGQSFTGDYYTVPSDVILGKAKEELPSAVAEYYAFDLTKAKVAYALKDLGVKYGDVDLTQVSTEALVGMSEDLLATYDLIYIGGDISAMDRSLDEMYAYNPIGNGTGASALGYGIPSFIMYTHTGMLQLVKASSSIKNLPVMATGLTNGESDVYMPENGNDLTKTKYDQLVSYVASGRPIMVSKELTSVYEKMKGYNVPDNTKELSLVQLLSGYWFKDDGSIERGNMYLDPSSRVYKLLDTIYARKNSSAKTKNVLWGVDMSDNQPIDNVDMMYGDGLWTMKVEGGKQEVFLDSEAQKKKWYTTESTSYKVYKKYAMVPSDINCSSIKNLVSGSEVRARITMLNKPTTYVQGIEQTYTKSTSLQFEFTVSGSLKSYKYKLYIDKDRNSSFEADTDKDYYQSGNVKPGENTKVTVKLDDTFFGSAAWYLEICDGDDKVISTTEGLCKIVKTIEGKSDINVLQIQTMADGQSADYQTMPDMLYFDIESQWAHKIMYYNGLADDVRFDSAMNLKQCAALGRHENRFGIVKYDYTSSDDDWFSNWADEISEDYDVNLDMVVATADKAKFTTVDNVSGEYNCLDTWVEEAEKLKDGVGKVGGFTMSDYATMADAELDLYNQYAADVEAPKKALDDYLTGAIAHLNGTKKNDAKYSSLINNMRNGSKEDWIDLYQTAIDTGDYYMIFLKWFSKTVGDTSVDFSQYGEFGKLFVAYRDAKDRELDARDKYQTYLRRSKGDKFLQEMYSILVLGPSDDFGDFQIDLKPVTCEYIKAYVENGGDLFFFHDTMTPYYKAGAYNLTTTLLDVVGMNRFHVDVTNQKNSYTSKTIPTITGYTQASPAGVAYGTLEEDGYLYQDMNGKTGLPEGYANFTGTLTEACDVLDYSYKHQNDSSWTRVGENVTLIDAWGNVNTNSDMVKKTYEAGSQISDMYVHQDAVDFEKLGYVENNKISRYGYFKKVEAKKGDSGYIYQDAVEGGQPIYGTPVNELEFKSKDSDLYYLTPYANNPSLMQTAGLYGSLKSNIMDSVKSGSLNQVKTDGWNISALSMSSMYYAMDKSMGDGKYLNYIYACMDVNDAVRKTVRDGNHDETDLSQTAKASQLNDGLVTLYPFNIGSSLNISGTHQQAYSLDLENSNTKVWYTLAGCNNASNKKAKSSMYAADPYDAMESYFIYTSAYGSGAITYCGAGHTSVTGSKTKNNDERKLFINVIVNSAKAVQPAPSIKCYEPKETWAAEDELPKDEEVLAATGRTMYVKTVESKSETPEFDYKITKPANTKITKIRLFYDLNYDDTDYENKPSYDAKTDKLITEYTKKGDTNLVDIAGDLKEIARNGKDVKLAPSDEYFAPYGGTYTYIVVQIYYQGKTEPVYVMIRVKASDPLFDLTDNTINVPAFDDFIAEKKNVFA